MPPSRNMLDTASAFWMAVAAAMAAVLLIWLASSMWAQSRLALTQETPAIVTQPIVPPAPVPATKPNE